MSTTITDIRTVAIPVADQDRAVAFYVDVLGFESRMDAEIGPGTRWVEVAPPGGAVTLALVAGAPDAVGGDTGVRLVSTAAEREHHRLEAAGVAVGELLRWPGVPPMFTFPDPDGNTLYVVEVIGDWACALPHSAGTAHAGPRRPPP